MLVAILGPRHDGLREAELYAGQIHRVGLAVWEEDVQDFVLVVGCLPVLTDEAATVEAVEGEGDFADFGIEVWRIRIGWRYVNRDGWIVGGGMDGLRSRTL